MGNRFISCLLSRRDIFGHLSPLGPGINAVPGTTLSLVIPFHPVTPLVIHPVPRHRRKICLTHEGLSDYVYAVVWESGRQNESAIANEEELLNRSHLRKQTYQHAKSCSDYDSPRAFGLGLLSRRHRGRDSKTQYKLLLPRALAFRVCATLLRIGLTRQ